MRKSMPLAAMQEIEDDSAVAYIQKYFEDQPDGRPWFTGSRFETVTGGGGACDVNRITCGDLIAVSMLSVHVPAQAVIGIGEDLAEEIEGLLSQIPSEAKLEEIGAEEFKAWLDVGSPADRLWTLMRQRQNPWKVGPTTVSKILARKRPHLIPIYDSVVAAKTGLPDSRPQWRRWFDAFQGEEGRDFADRLRRIREHAGTPHLSLIRVLDIVLWMDGRGYAKVSETVGDEA
jgi:hypothetical protein